MSDEAHNHLRLVPPPEGPLVDAPSWVRRLRGIQDSHLRLHRLSSLVETDPALFGELFEHVRVRLGEEQPRTIYLDLVRLLSGAAPVRYAVRERLYVRARTRNVPVLRLLLVKAVTRPAGDVDHLPDPTLEDLTLGERKALARTAGGELLRRLSTDPDPRVVRLLLDHRQMTEELVIKAAARRPAHPSALAAIVHHPRWGARASVHEAVARNPSTATGLAAGLVPLLRSRVRQAMLRGSATKPLVRAIAAWEEGDREPVQQLMG